MTMKILLNSALALRLFFFLLFLSWWTFESSGLNAESPAAVYPGLILAMAAGLFGASFSMLVQLSQRTSQGTLEDVQAAAGWHSLLVRCSFGVGAAAILYFFFESGLLQGSLWPDIEDLKFKVSSTGKIARVANNNWCLLVIWSFLAGFSENFVPTILIRTEARNQPA
jgi:hypothetical protein